MAFTKRGSAFSLVILIYLSLFSLGYSSEATYAWKKTSEDIRIWINQDSLDYDYSWIGKNVEGVAHGAGILVISKNGYELSRDGKKAYYGSFLSDSYIYENGELSIGLRDDDGNITGFAVVVLSSGYKYIGELYNDSANGYGSLIRNDSIYRGNWVKGQLEGEGEVCDRNENCKKSVWNNNKNTCKSDSVKTVWGTYIGASICKNGQLYANGKGILVSDQDTLEGVWENNSLVGEVIHKANGYLYKGGFDGNKYSGKGVITSENFTFSGTFVNGEPSGYGEFHGSNGNSYLGEWKNGLMNGHGRYETANYVYEGSWFDGTRNGKGFAEYGNGDYYEGEFVANMRYGQGRYEFANGDIYEGEFVNDKIHGLGSYNSIAGGYYYEGEFSNNKFQGDGSLHLFSGNDSLVITAYWPGNGSLPSKASILFANGDLYEGELKEDGNLSENGIWSRQAERDTPNVGKPKDLVHQANNFFKEHEKTWRKFVLGATAVFTVTQFIPIPPVAAFSVTANTVLNVVDLLATTASAGIDLYDSVQVGGSIAKPLITIGIQAGANYLGTKVPGLANKALKSSAGKAVVNRLSSSATTVSASIINLFEKRFFCGKIIRVVKNESGVFVKKMVASNIGRRILRVTGRESDQFISVAVFKKCAEDNKEKFKFGMPGDGKILWDNMFLCLSERARKRVKLDKEFNPKDQRPPAHHVVPKGKSPCPGSIDVGEKTRNILKKCGNIDINDPRNGILLPSFEESILTGIYHIGYHPCKYYTSVYERIKTAQKNDGCNEYSMEKALDGIKHELYNCTMQLNDKKRGICSFYDFAGN